MTTYFPVKSQLVRNKMATSRIVYTFQSSLSMTSLNFAASTPQRAKRSLNFADSTPLRTYTERRGETSTIAHSSEETFMLTPCSLAREQSLNMKICKLAK